MNLNDRVKTLNDVTQVANKLFPCTVTVDPITGGFGEKSDGTRIIKLIVGWKKNPIYDPNITNQQDKRSQLKTADVRIISIMPGITAKELIDIHLTKIQKSLQDKDQVLDNEITRIEKKPLVIPSDDELAAQLEQGKPTAVGDEGWTDERSSTLLASWEDEQEEEKPMNANLIEPDNRLDDIISGITLLNDNIQTVANDLTAVNKRLEKVEETKSQEIKTKNGNKK